MGLKVHQNSFTNGILFGTTDLSGGQIKFPGTQSSSADANTLDDYEEGTFTPTVGGAITPGTGTYSAQAGFYTKIGRVVYFNLYISWTNLTGSAGIFVTYGFPFTSSATANNISAVSIYVSNVALTASNLMTGIVDVSKTGVTLYQYPVGGGAASTVPVDTSGEVILSGFYSID